MLIVARTKSTAEDDDNGIKLGMLGGLHFHFYQIWCADV